MNDVSIPERTIFNIFTMRGIGREWTLIQGFYGDKRAKRSQVPLINHIIEGVEILDTLQSPFHAKGAFCIHPMVQADDDLRNNFDDLRKLVGGDVLALAIEYRSVANEYLSRRNISSIEEIRLSPLYEVNQMLIADKVQNYKDFILYHHGTHPRSTELHHYFRNWIARLECEGIMDEIFPEWRNYE